MSGEDIFNRFDEITNLVNCVAENECELLDAGIALLQLGEASRQKALEKEAEISHIKAEFAEKQKEKEKLQRSLALASSLLNQEQIRCQVALRNRDAIKQEIQAFITATMSSRRVPQHVKDAIKERCENFETSQHYESIGDTDPSEVTCSESDSVSDSWHLYVNNTTVPVSRLSLCSPRLSSTSSNGENDRLSCSNSVCLFEEFFDRIKSRPHEYKTKNLVLGETCGVCELRISCGKQAFKCTSCKAIVHHKCKDSLMKPCIPICFIRPGTKDIKNFCSDYTPMIPGVVIHAVLYIEQYGSNEVRLYSLPVYDKNVTRLKELFFKGRGVPNLSKYGVEIVSAFLKEFFALLDPPLIPHKYFSRFLTLSKNPSIHQNYDKLMEEVMLLPCPNRDTLAYLILHLQNIAACANIKMNSYLLARTFAPILIENYKFEDFKREKLYKRVIQNFIDMSPDFWKRILMQSK